MTRNRTSTPQSPQQLIERARAVAERWKARLRDGIRPTAHAAAARGNATGSANRPLEDLHDQLAELETEIASIERQRSELRADNRPAEERAMAAIRAGDDHAAKAALDELRASAQFDTLFEADLTGLRALAGECRDFLATVDQRAPDAPSGLTNRQPNDR